MEISYFPFITPPTFDLHFIQKMGNPHKELPIYFANYYIHSNVFIVGNNSTSLIAGELVSSITSLSMP